DVGSLVPRHLPGALISGNPRIAFRQVLRVTTASRKTRRFRPIHFVLSLLLALGGLAAFAAPAQAAVNDIAGTVSSLDPGHPVPVGTKIYLSVPIDPASGFTSGPLFASAVPVTTTTAGGSYTISGLTIGR